MEQSWIRRDGESSAAYTAFREYLSLGGKRTLAKVGENLGKTVPSVELLSVKHEWVARSRDYDSYVLQAATDGEVNLLGESRDENLALMRKLKGHLSNRLDGFIARDEDPTMRWTQALAAMAKVEQNFLLIKDDAKTTEKLDNVMELVAKVVENAGRIPA